MFQAKKSKYLLACATLVLLAAGCGSSPQDNASSGSGSTGPLAGKKILFSPYWLDNFGTATASWVVRGLEAEGAKVDVTNSNGVATKQLNTLETAISSRNYDGIIWQPNDKVGAPINIKKIIDAKIPQVVMGSNVKSQPGLNFSQSPVDYAVAYTAAGEAAAKFIKAHPELGPPAIAFQNLSPISVNINAEFEGLVRGVRKISPEAKVVYNEGASSQAQAMSKMTDFISRNIPFNIFAGGGSLMSLGGISAINAAGLGGAVNKVPEHVYMMSADGTPPELAYLWSPTSSLMRSIVLPPKDTATAVIKLITDELTGKVAYNETAIIPHNYSPLTPDCNKERPYMLQQFAGVPNFTVPSCSFKYTEEG